jgi:hypothetical protein
MDRGHARNHGRLARQTAIKEMCPQYHANFGASFGFRIEFRLKMNYDLKTREKMAVCRTISRNFV